MAADEAAADDALALVEDAAALEALADADEALALDEAAAELEADVSEADMLDADDPLAEELVAVDEQAQPASAVMQTTSAQTAAIAANFFMLIPSLAV